jgi:D-3-phosphoglycerate dehydrogenase
LAQNGAIPIDLTGDHIYSPLFATIPQPFLPYRIPETPYIVPHFVLTYKADSTIFLPRKSNVLSLDSTIFLFRKSNVLSLRLGKMAKVLVQQPIHPDALKRLAEEVEVLTPYKASNPEILEMMPGIDAFLLGVGIDLGPQEMDLAPKLQVIGRHGVGLDNVDLDAATARGIPVVYTPYGPTESTAEHAFTLILATARRLSLMDGAVRSGNWAIAKQPRAMGLELKGKSLGIVGYGRIGRRLADMCRSALEMSIYVFDPFLDASQVAKADATPVEDLIELAGMVDVLSIHVPLTTQTNKMINRDVVQAMKPNAILINASRGPVVDEEALIEVLKEDRIFGAGMDVYDPEPPIPDNPLFKFDHVVLTPHIASLTEEGRQLMGLTVVEGILRVLKAQQPEYIANPEVWEKRRVF